MENGALKRFEELNELVAVELKGIAQELIDSHSTYQKAVDTITDHYESDYKLDNCLYSEIHKKAMDAKTGH